jgi:ABC-type sugar transport system ATPase subunit
VAIAQAMNCKPRLLLLEEPTRGVDIQSKREIYRLLCDFVQAGNVVIMFCKEALEVYEAADRAHVITDGLMSPPIVVHDYAHVERLATTSPTWNATTARVPRDKAPLGDCGLLRRTPLALGGAR